MFLRLQSRRPHVFIALVSLLFLSLASSPLRAEIGSYILIDASNGSVLAEGNATRKWYPASLSKMMTAYLAFKAIHEGKATLNSVVTQSQNSIAEPPSKMGFKVGTQLTLENALKIMLIKSANDIAVAVAEAIGGSEPAFIDMMNREARRLGMKDTSFVNPNGLPDNRQISTAQDLAILAQALRRDFPEARAIYKHPGIKFGKKKLRSANREFLLRVKGANGMKTGFICNSGYNVAASITRHGRTLIAVVLGAASGLERIAFTRKLMEKGFKTRSGRYSLKNLPRKGGTPPADHYCKRNKDADIDDFMARYDMKAKRSPILSFFSNKDQGKPIMPGVGQAKAKKGSASDVKLANGKVDWRKVLDRTIGPRRMAYVPITVHVGVPNVAIRTENVPVPRRHPGRSGAKEAKASAPAGAVAQKDFVKAGKQDGQVAPGSLFQKRNNSELPVPGYKPKG